MIEVTIKGNIATWNGTDATRLILDGKVQMLIKFFHNLQDLGYELVERWYWKNDGLIIGDSIENGFGNSEDII